jgi:2-polyprenyl-3-methyl-5-hydroxy-6-metoxy-1,4-benzoquinol methylase
MTKEQPDSEFAGYTDENRRIWDANAQWWDNRIGDGNDFQTILIEPSTERLLSISYGDIILDIACGAGRFARRMAELGARVVAFDHSSKFIERARERSGTNASVEYHVIDAGSDKDLVSLGEYRFDKAVCSMALMDMPEITPLVLALTRILKPNGAFVFSVTHPCFHSATIQRFAEMYEQEAGQHIIHTGVKISSYLTPFVKKTEGIIGQPEPHFYYHRSLHVLLQPCFQAGFVLDGIEEPGFPEPDKLKAGVSWNDMPEIPPVMVVRMKLIKKSQQVNSADR